MRSGSRSHVLFGCCLWPRARKLQAAQASCLSNHGHLCPLFAAHTYKHRGRDDAGGGGRAHQAGKRHGIGTMYFKDGSKAFTSDWRDDQRVDLDEEEEDDDDSLLEETSVGKAD